MNEARIIPRNQRIGLLLAGAMLWLSFGPAWAADPLQIKLTEKGVVSLTYAGVEYCDPTDCGVLGFNDRPPQSGNLWSPCVLDAQKSNNPFSRVPTAAAVQGSTVTKTYPWGTLAATYTVKGADLYVTATITNASKTPMAWWKANLLQLNSRLVFDARPHNDVFPFGYTPNMHWDYAWQMWWGQDNGYDTWNFTDPHVYWWVDKAAPFDKAPVKVMFADLDPKWQTGVYHVKTDHGDAWPVIGATDGDPGGANTPSVAPGKSDTVRVVIRFRPGTESAITACADGYEAFGRAYPRTVRWTDRRAIGTYFACRGNNLGGTNTNGWFNDKTVDIDSAEGRKAFAVKLLAEIDTIIGVLKDVGAQGVIWWDLEGARNPHPITYIGDPRVLDPKHPQHDKFVPELDTEVTYKDKKMKLVDACFRKFQDAGLKTGVTIRPNALVWDGSPKQTGDGKDADNLCAKATYARERWGCTIFYVDSVSEWFSNWSFEKTAAKYPDILLLPEWARTRSYRHSSAFSHTQWTHFVRGVPAEMQACWPDAFCCMSHYDANKDYDDLLQGVKNGNLMMFNCWYMCDEAKASKKIYQTTGTRHTPVAQDQQVATPRDAPVQITLRATDEDKDKVTCSILGPPEHGVLGALNAATGTLTYTPAAGYTGKDLFTFTATDATGLRGNRATVTINVNAAAK